MRLLSHLTPKTAIGLLIAAPIIGVGLFLWAAIPTKTHGPIQGGVTFSQIYAQELGLDWRETLTALLDDLHVRRFRIPAYWNIVEPARGQYDWSSLDFQMDEIARRKGSVLLAVGMKLPRWPECWMPGWAKTLPANEEQQARLHYLTAVVERYKNHPALHAWQVENEALFVFGECPKPDAAFFRHELELVRSLDDTHPITTTDSGELSTWLRTGPHVDRLGVSVYRIIRTHNGFIWPYVWVPPYWYAKRAQLLSPWVDEVFVSEFQMEPWVKTTMASTTIPEQFETFDLKRMHANFDFAARLRINDVYFWGAEWWYWMKTKQNDSRFWDTAKLFFTQ